MLLHFPVLFISLMRCAPAFHPRDVLLHFPFLVNSLTRGAPAISSSSHFAHEMCSCIFQSYSYRSCDVLPHFPVLVNSLTRGAPAISSFSHFAHECVHAISNLIHIAHALCSAAVFSSSSQFFHVIMLQHFSPF